MDQRAHTPRTEKSRDKQTGDAAQREKAKGIAPAIRLRRHLRSALVVLLRPPTSFCLPRRTTAGGTTNHPALWRRLERRSTVPCNQGAGSRTAPLLLWGPVRPARVMTVRGFNGLIVMLTVGAAAARHALYMADWRRWHKRSVARRWWVQVRRSLLCGLIVCLGVGWGGLMGGGRAGSAHSRRLQDLPNPRLQLCTIDPSSVGRSV